MIDLHESVTALFAEAQVDSHEHFTDGFRFLQRGVPCSACGLTDFYHQRFGCRPPVSVTIAYRKHDPKNRRPPVVGPFVHVRPDAVCL